ncbi:MAG TPA: alcohol dehydrogenase catalytic domain-containing protein [Candidatus Lokiarchaeia archaeon]|nr:alcohol dehydrogenase catalytic domain-containing protein [Candidatus Lokiarchaeia archaeon]
MGKKVAKAASAKKAAEKLTAKNAITAPSSAKASTMRQLQIPEPFTVVIGEIPQIEPAENEVQVDIAYCGICGSDIHAYKGKHPFVPTPAYPGHEGAGIISKLGKGAEKYGLKIGDKVTFEPNLNCGTCYNCRRGRYNICLNLKVMGCQMTERTKGMMADKFVSPANKVVKLPKDMSLKKAAMTEPLAVGIHAVRRSGIQVGDHVVILGAGTIGLSCLQFAKLAGANILMVADFLPKRLEIAKKLGATHVVDLSKEGSVADYLAKNPQIMGEEGVDIAFECVGVEGSMNDCIKIARKGSTIMVLGVFGDEVNHFNAAWVQDREFNILGSLMYTWRDVTDTVDAIYKNKVNVDAMITNTFDLNDGAAAFDAGDTLAKDNIKVMIKVSGKE